MGNVYIGGQKVCPILKINDYQPTIEPLSVTPTTSEQTITAPAGTDGYSPITVDAVDASIDSNIAAGNIKSGVTILGVTGNVVQSNTTTLSVTPTTSAQSLSPSSPYNGYSSVSVAAVTAAIDPDIIESNIKSGVNILGVNGTVTELKGETRSVSLTDEAGQTFTPTSGKNGITSITVTPNNKDQSITPTTSAQSISVPSGYSGNGDISVSAVTSSIDANIQPENIIDGVTILGVTGTYEPTLITKSITENGTYTASSDNADGYSSVSVDVDTVNNTTLSVTPSTSAQSFSPSSPYTGYGSVSVDAVDSTIDANIVAGNIKSGVSILGVTGNVVQLNGTTKTITPSTTSQTVTPISPSNGFTSVTVPAVTSAIDANIQAENIVDGVTILGVTGTAEESNPTTLAVTPTTSAQTLTPSAPYNGFDEVNVSAVTSSIDSNIAAENIKSGVTILGVSGTVTELNGETRSVSITSTAGNTFTPSEGKNGITSITVTPTNQNRTVTATTSEQTIGVNTGYSGNGTITVNPVTASIDSNITAGNIKDGVTILGVTGSVEELNATTLNVTPTTSAQTLSPESPYNGFDEVNVEAVTSSIDPNIAAGNIKSGVSILGVNGTVTELNGTTLSVTPTTSAQSITPTSPNNGFTSVSVDAVTSSIDNNITAGNIKSGVSILGVSGSVTELKGETRSVSLTNKNGQTFTPSSGKNGITSITVTPTNQAKTITPTTSQQSISVPNGYSGFGALTVNAVTASIDSNITAGNIKNGVTILGVTGTMQSGYTEISSYQVLNGVANRRSGALTGNEFSNITSVGNGGLYYAFCGCSRLTGNINLSSLTSVGYNGLNSTFRECSGLTSVDLSSLTSVGNGGLNYAFSLCSGLTGNINLSSLTSVGEYGLSYAFRGCSGLTSVDLSSLTSVDATSGLYYAFTDCTGLTSVNLSSLTSVGGTNGLSYAFSGCSRLTSVGLSSLTSVVGMNGLAYAFNGCSRLTDIYFNSLTTTSFGSYINQFIGMIYRTGTSVTHTLHFPSNLESTISGLSGYPLFGGASGYVTLSFDLPATS